MGSRTNRAHDARARAREARAVMLAERHAQDERIEGAVAAALLAIEDRAAALAEAERAGADAGGRVATAQPGECRRPRHRDDDRADRDARDAAAADEVGRPTWCQAANSAVEADRAAG